MTDAGSPVRFDAAPGEPSAHAIPTNTWPMWGIAVLPIVGIALDALGLGPRPSPTATFTVSIAFIPLVVGLVLAAADRRILLERGVVRPLHWGWAFLAPVYPIARSVVVHRRVGGSLAPLWLWIASSLVALAVGSLVG